MHGWFAVQDIGRAIDSSDVARQQRDQTIGDRRLIGG